MSQPSKLDDVREQLHLELRLALIRARNVAAQGIHTLYDAGMPVAEAQRLLAEAKLALRATEQLVELAQWEDQPS